MPPFATSDAADVTVDPPQGARRNARVTASVQLSLASADTPLRQLLTASSAVEK